MWRVVVGRRTLISGWRSLIVAGRWALVFAWRRALIITGRWALIVSRRRTLLVPRRRTLVITWRWTLLLSGGGWGSLIRTVALVAIALRRYRRPRHIAVRNVRIVSGRIVAVPPIRTGLAVVRFLVIVVGDDCRIRIDGGAVPEPDAAGVPPPAVPAVPPAVSPVSSGPYRALRRCEPRKWYMADDDGVEGMNAYGEAGPVEARVEARTERSARYRATKRRTNRCMRMGHGVRMSDGMKSLILRECRRGGQGAPGEQRRSEREFANDVHTFKSRISCRLIGPDS